MKRYALRRIALAAGLAAAFSFATAAGADTNQVKINVAGDGQGWVHDPGKPILTVNGMMPGSDASTVFGVLNDSTYDTDLSISSANIRDDDNGCKASESVVDSTCGGGEGELSHELVFSLYVDKTRTGTFDAAPVWSGNIRDLSEPVTVVGQMSAHAAWDVKVNVDFPRSSGNETQSDALGFTLRIGTAALPVQVLGEKARRGGALPFTGAELAVLGVAAAIAAALGVTILRVADKRGSRRG
ncbi:MAG TPA: hypothetical protein VFJ17_13275 [Mycobacteriales bacterium]|jgi:hypothetical protein|nr:hypothetical protein [Mycobacteriales bacterium]